MPPLHQTCKLHAGARLGAIGFDETVLLPFVPASPATFQPSRYRRSVDAGVANDLGDPAFALAMSSTAFRGDVKRRRLASCGLCQACSRDDCGAKRPVPRRPAHARNGHPYCRLGSGMAGARREQPARAPPFALISTSSIDPMPFRMQVAASTALTSPSLAAKVQSLPPPTPPPPTPPSPPPPYTPENVTF